MELPDILAIDREKPDVGYFVWNYRLYWLLIEKRNYRFDYWPFKRVSQV